MARVLRGGPPARNQEVVLERPDGTQIIVMVTIDPMTDGDGQVVGAINLFQDVTAHRRAEQQLAKAKALAEEASKAKDQFLAVLSHELRTPLSPVVLSLATMAADPALPPHLREDLAMIRRNIGLETRLIDDLLDLSRVINGKLALNKEDVAVHPLIADVAEMMEAEIKAGKLDLQLQLEAARDHVYADAARLHQVLWNLLKNAAKFTPAHGKISIRTSNRSDDALAIEVEDSGIGIEAQALSSIFNAFDQGAHTANRSLGGLGLGLAISKAVIDMHQGAISAHSAGKGHGSRFTVALPLAKASHPPQIDHGTQKPKAPAAAKAACAPPR